MKEYIQIQVTMPDKTETNQLIDQLLQDKLIACAQISKSIESKYWWDGKIQSDTEMMCLFKTERSLYDQVEQAILESHPYQVPEIIVLPILIGHRDYLDWISKSVQKVDPN